MCFYLIFGFFRFKVVDKRTLNLFEGSEDSGFSNFIWLDRKNVIFFQTILSFVLSRKIIKIYSDIARKHGNVTVKDFRKYEKLKYKQNKLKLDIDFLNNCKQLGN